MIEGRALNCLICLVIGEREARRRHVVRRGADIFGLGCGCLSCG